MNREDIARTHVAKYGAIETARYHIRGVRAALSNIRNGIETNNFALASKDVGLLADHLASLEAMFNVEDARKQLQNLDKNSK